MITLEEPLWFSGRVTGKYVNENQCNPGSLLSPQRKLKKVVEMVTPQEGEESGRC
jgi:hypothetical protein